MPDRRPVIRLARAQARLVARALMLYASGDPASPGDEEENRRASTLAHRLGELAG